MCSGSAQFFTEVRLHALERPQFETWSTVLLGISVNQHVAYSNKHKENENTKSELSQFSLSHHCQEASNTAKDITDEPLYNTKKKHVVKQMLSCSANLY